MKYFERPVNYGEKTETSFKVLQVLDTCALAQEFTDTLSEASVVYDGNTVLLLGKDFYDDQIVTVKKPQRVGTYKYKYYGEPKTVPVIKGEME